MADTADTADIMVETPDIMADTADILARYRREAGTTSAEVGRNSPAAHRGHIVAGAAATGAAVTGVAATGAAVTGVAATGAADLVIRTTPIGAGAILTRTRTTAIILLGIILRIGMTIAPYQEGNSFGTDPSVRFAPTNVRTSH